MFKYLLFAPTLFLLSCGGNSDENDETENEYDVKIKAYCEENGIKAERQKSGLYVYVEKEGSKEKPNNDSYVTLIYEGRLIDGTLFESTNGEAIPSGIPLDYYIEGWREGIPHFGRGGKGTIIVPPDLGFGAEGKGYIPGNSILVFDLELVDFGLEPPPPPDYSGEILTYMEMKGLDSSDAIVTESGLFIFIEKAGSKEKPTVNDYLTLNYEGYLLNDKSFDGTGGEPTTFSFPLAQTIQGWQEGIPYFGKGGKGKLIIPPYIGYGNQGSQDGSIPPDAVLVFDIELIDFSATPPAN